MAKSVQAIVKPELLAWARRSSGYDLETTARKVGINPQRLEMWEKGEARPTIKQLRNLARVYKRPIAVFYLPEPPRDFQAMKDFRALTGRAPREMSPELRLAIRQAHERRELARELAENIENEVSMIPVSARLQDDPEQLALEIRTLLGVSIEDQRKWAPGRVSFNNWRKAFEDLGILVFQIYGTGVDEVRGFSLNTAPLPVIAVNVKDSHNARIFTLFHELAHILLHNTGVCDLSEEANLSSARVEFFCNRVAGACLLPMGVIMGEGVAHAHVKDIEWTDNEIQRFSGEFGISRETFTRRLVFAGLVDEAFYQEKREQYQSEYDAASPKSNSGFAPPHVKALSSLGNMFVNLVLQNFYQDNITANSVSDHLDMKLGHLGKLESALSSSRNS